MSNFLNPGVVGAGFFAWLILSLVFAGVGMRQGSLLYQSTETERVYRTRPGGRMFIVMLGLLFTLGGPLFYASAAVSPSPHGQPMPVEGWLAFAILVSMNIAMGTLCFLISGPNELYLNLDSRTYRHRYGLRHKPQVRTGPMDDIGGLYLRHHPNVGSHNVHIAWKTERGWSPLLGTFGRSFRAERFIDETAASLGLLLVEPPPVGKTVSTKVIHPHRWY